MAPQRSTSMNRMWQDWRNTFPDTNTAQDGWIGDPAHMQGVSGHNPDDTPGVTAERQDADSKQEVRGIDKDKRLNSPVTLEQVIQRMLRTPVDLARLIYIIYNRRIWRKSNGWKQEAYTGDPHDIHAHFSGDPASDENGAEWKSITSFGEDMAGIEPTDPSYVDIAYTVSDMSLLNDNISGGPDAGKPNPIARTLKAIDTQAKANGAGITEIKTLVRAGGVTQEMLNFAIVEAMKNPEVLASLSNAINDDAARRLAE